MFAVLFDDQILFSLCRKAVLLCVKTASVHSSMCGGSWRQNQQADGQVCWSVCSILLFFHLSFFPNHVGEIKINNLLWWSYKYYKW